jgi:hypothetical protein
MAGGHHQLIHRTSHSSEPTRTPAEKAMEWIATEVVSQLTWQHQDRWP